MTQPTVLIAIKKFFFLLLFSLMGLSLCFHAPLFEKNWEGVEQTWGGFEVNSEKKKKIIVTSLLFPKLSTSVRFSFSLSTVDHIICVSLDGI